MGVGGRGFCQLDRDRPCQSGSCRRRGLGRVRSSAFARGSALGRWSSILRRVRVVVWVRYSVPDAPPEIGNLRLRWARKSVETDSGSGWSRLQTTSVRRQLFLPARVIVAHQTSLTTVAGEFDSPAGRRGPHVCATPCPLRRRKLEISDHGGEKSPLKRTPKTASRCSTDILICRLVQRNRCSFAVMSRLIPHVSDHGGQRPFAQAERPISFLPAKRLSRPGVHVDGP